MPSRIEISWRGEHSNFACENSTFAPPADFYSTRQESAIFTSLNSGENSNFVPPADFCSTRQEFATFTSLKSGENSTFAPPDDFYSTRQESANFTMLKRQRAKFSMCLLWKIAYTSRVEWRCLTRVLPPSFRSGGKLHTC